MKIERNEIVDQYLNRKNVEYEKALAKKKSKRKGIIFGIGIAILGAVTTITGIFHSKKYNKYEEPKNKIETIADEIDDIDLDAMGFEEEEAVAENSNKEIYGKTTGDVDKNKVVEKNGTIYKDQEAADKSDQVGKEEIDTKDDTLVVQPNGTVTEKEQDYVVKDEEGNIKDNGSNESGIPEGYAWDADRNEYVKKEEVGLYIYSDATYYYGDGTVALEKGVLISKKDFEIIKKYCTTTKPVVKSTTEDSNPKKSQTTPAPEATPAPETTPEVTPETIVNETFTPTEGVVNPDGTYTIDGITFQSKSDYEQWVIQGYEGYAIDISDGIMKSTDGKTLVKSR